MPFLKPYKYPNWKLKEESTLKNGLRHTVFNSKGDTKYVGEWENNEKSGKGFQIVKDKWVYEGDWLNGKRHGYGIMSYQDENMIRHITYEGDWKFGKPDVQGFGTKHYNDGSIYEGHFRGGNRWGNGRIWYPDNSFYDGSWKNDKQCGSGLMVYANGNRYEGDWFDGMKYGQGTYYFPNKGQKQTGVWVEDTATVSLIEDWQFQGATKPRQYLVPPVELENWTNIYNKEVQSKLHCCDARTTLMRLEWPKMTKRYS